MSLRRSLLVIAFLALAACGQNRYVPKALKLEPAFYEIDEDDRPADGKHLRYTRPGAKAGGLDIAVTEYIHPDGGARVLLYGVVHIADTHYYERVQRDLASYDAVLYEGVKKEGATAEEWQQSFADKGGETAHFQKKLAGWLDLQFQLDAIDYSADNFIHADMSIAEFKAEGGEKFIPALDDTDASADSSSDASDRGVAPGALKEKVRTTFNAVEEFGELALGPGSPIRAIARNMLAKTLGTIDMGEALDMFPGMHELIVIKRNQIVMERLRVVLPDESGTVAVFYGAAHMADLEKRLLSELGYKRDSARWLRAWAVRPKAAD